MVRFSCFPAPIHYSKSKKSVQRSNDTMDKNSQDFSQDQATKISITSSNSHPLESKPKVYETEPSNKSTEKATSCSSFEVPLPTTIQACPDLEVDQECWKVENLDSSSLEGNTNILRTSNLKKSQSVGSGLDRERRISFVVTDTEDEIDQGLPCDYICGMNFIGTLDSFGHDGFIESFYCNDPENNVVNPSSCFLGHPDDQNIAMNAGLINVASIGDLDQIEREVRSDFGRQLSAENVSNGGHCSPGTSQTIAKSYSLPDLGACATSPGKDSMIPRVSVPRSRSSEDLYILDVRRGNSLEREDKLCFGKEISELSPLRCEIPCSGASVEDSAPSNRSGGSYEMDQERNRIIERDELDYETPLHRWGDLSGKEFNIKRVEEWISKIDIQNSSRSPSEEVGECSSSVQKAKKDSNGLCVATTAKIDARFSHGMEVANNYISSLTALSTSAQMANLGLVLAPHLSIFSGLRVINLSGNAIVRITAGALPRGLRMLNLSRNNISTIEGLRELTRLRVLDLSYNRIFRIGHGLASCSSLKALYLAGNKISELEGLHRLLKLNVLDLSFNKISTAKCLGQLAANYGSLQIINLEGNPAQKNVGDEQLKKSLLSLLPKLIYLNGQPIKTSSSKEVSSHSVTMRQFDHGVRSEHKTSRKGSHGSSTHKPGSSSGHGVGLPKRAKSRHGPLPPSRAKGTHQPIVDNTLLTERTTNAMRRSRSEGTL